MKNLIYIDDVEILPAYMKDGVATKEAVTLTCVKDVYVHGPCRLVVLPSTVATECVYLVTNGNSSMIDTTRPTLQMHRPLSHSAFTWHRHKTLISSHILNTEMWKKPVTIITHECYSLIEIH